MGKGEKIAGAIAGTLGIGSVVGTGYFVIECVDAVSVGAFDSELADFGASTSEMWNGATDIADGNTPALTTALGMMSSVAGSSAGGGIIIRVFSENSKPYNVVEKRAKQIYDHYNTSHAKEKDEGVSLLVDDPAIAELVHDVLDSAHSKTELLNALNVVEKIIKEDTGSQQFEPKGQSYEKK